MSSVIARFALLAALPVLGGATDLVSNLEVRALAAHNRERSALGLEPLSWNDELQASAQLWADHLAENGLFEHAPERGTNPQGENLWAGTPGYYSVDQMVGAWAAERKYFRRAAFPHNSVTGDIRDVGHYTQLVWRETHQLGCAIAHGKAEDVFVCRYSEPGNYIGETPY